MGNSSSKNQKLDQNDIVFVGVDNAGKSTIIRQLLNHVQLTTTCPTNGYEAYSYYHPIQRSCNRTDLMKCSLIDLGGHEKIREIWKNYFSTSQAFVFVFDASDEARYPVVKECLDRVLSNKEAQRLPKLFLANKQDLRCAIKTQKDFEERFEMKLDSNAMFQSCVGIVYDDPGIAEGHSWLFARALAPELQEYAKLQKEQLKKQRVGAGMTTEEKLKRLEEIKRRNDEQEAEEKRIQAEAAQNEVQSHVEHAGQVLENCGSQEVVVGSAIEDDEVKQVKPIEESPDAEKRKPRVKKPGV